MKKDLSKLTTSQFANEHHVNKRTLHYYDEIGLFSPQYKGENGYRYYDISQGMLFELIKTLKDLNLSIEEIKQLIAFFDEQKFLQMTFDKQKEIDQQIAQLQKTKKCLAYKQEHLLLCQNVQDMEIKVLKKEKDIFSTIPYPTNDDDNFSLFQYIQKYFDPQQYRLKVGSFIALEKILKKQFDDYDGLFSPFISSVPNNTLLIKEKGHYLCGYLQGTWKRLPLLYQNMLDYATQHHYKLVGYAFEESLNDLIMNDEKNNITEISIKIDENS